MSLVLQLKTLTVFGSNIFCGNVIENIYIRIYSSARIRRVLLCSRQKIDFVH